MFDILDMLKRIDELLKFKHLQKMDFYSQIKISDGAVSQWRTGKTKPSMKSISKIADALNVSPQYLMYGSEQKEKPIIVSDDGPSEEDITEDDLSVDEKMLLSMYREIPKSQKVAAFSGFLDLLKKIEKT